MDSKTARVGLFLALSVVAIARAEQSDLVVGEQLYVAQCKICHGSVSAPQTTDNTPIPSQWRFVRVAMQQVSRATMSDVPGLMTAGTASGAHVGGDVINLGPIAFAPPFGPNLRGVYGRPAGAVKDFQYSQTLLKTLAGMEWNDASLDVWITNPQAWAPGVYMFYKQPDPEIRRKIILYLKANP
jgi:cytochrome c2